MKLPGQVSSYLKDESGQTSTEYILMVVVVVAIASSIFQKLEGYLISNPDSIKNTYLGSYGNMFSGQNGSYQGQYKYFTIKR